MEFAVGRPGLHRASEGTAAAEAAQYDQNLQEPKYSPKIYSSDRLAAAKSAQTIWVLNPNSTKNTGIYVHPRILSVPRKYEPGNFN